MGPRADSLEKGGGNTMAESGPARILVIDDDEVILATTEAVLGARGYRVTTHRGPFGASAEILRSKPDLVLLDLDMPGLSGHALAALVRGNEEAAGVRIVFYSSSDDETLQAAVDEAGAHGYIRKGDRKLLGERIAKALSS
jgi:PleD family two-component response regulator